MRVDFLVVETSTQEILDLYSLKKISEILK